MIDLTKSHGQGASHVEELVTGGANSHGGETSHHASSVPGSPGQDRSAQQTHRGDDGANDGTVSQPGQLLGAQAGLVGDGPGHHRATDHGGDADPHGEEASPGHQVHHRRGSEGGNSGASSGQH